MKSLFGYKTVFLMSTLLLLFVSAAIVKADINWAWHLEQIGWESALNDSRWADGLTFGLGQGIAVFDTGIDEEHLLFTDRQIGGENFTDDTPPLAPPEWQDGTGHGTAVASIAAGAEATLGDEENTHISGPARDADLWSVRVLDNDGGGSFDQINAGLEWVIDQTVNEGANIRAVNMSLGTTVTFIDPDELTGEVVDTFNSHAQTLRSYNIPIVAASGNSGEQEGLSFPAIAEDVIAVGSSDQDDQISEFTNRSEDLDMLAPGEAIPAALAREEEEDRADLVGFGSGTSFAAPLVTGAILLINEVYENRWGNSPTYDQIFDFVTFSDTVIEENDLAFPRLDLHASLERAYVVPEPGTIWLLLVVSLVWFSGGRRRAIILSGGK